MRSSLFAAGCFLLAFGCKHQPAPGESIADVCWPDNDQRDVSVSGYLRANFLFGCREKSCVLQLTQVRKEQYGLSVRLPLGDGPSTMTPLPPPRHAVAGAVERAPVLIRDAKGASVSVGDVVRVTGRMSARDSGGKLECEVTVARLEAL